MNRQQKCAGPKLENIPSPFWPLIVSTVTPIVLEVAACCDTALVLKDWTKVPCTSLEEDRKEGNINVNLGSIKEMKVLWKFLHTGEIKIRNRTAICTG